jgi:hypothetical protein
VRALAPRGRLAVYSAASRHANKVPTGRLMRASLSVVRFWLVNLLGERAANDAALAELFGRVLHRRRGRSPAGPTRRRRAARSRGPAARRMMGKLLLDPSA